MTSELRIPKGGLVLVTGATGLIGGATSEELLRLGYRVRGTTRKAADAQALADKFEKLFGKNVFELAEIKDYTASGAYDAAIKDVDGIVHTVTDFSFSSDIDAVVTNSRTYTLDILEAAVKSPSLKSFVLTSSIVGATTKFAFGEVMPVSKDSFAEYAWPEGKALSDDNPLKGQLAYNASKGETEKAAWEFYKQHKPQFVLNTLLPVFVLGPGPNPAIPTPSTVGMTYKLFKGDPTSPIPVYAKPSLAIVDVRDTAVLHVAALLASDVASERIWAFGHSVHINTILQAWREAFPDKKDTIPQDLEYNFAEHPKPDLSRSEELLRRFAGRKWYSAKDTIVATIPQE